MRIFSCLFVFFLGLSAAYAEPDIELVGKIEHTFPRATTRSHLFHAANQSELQSVTLLRIRLSHHAWSKLQYQVNNQTTNPSFDASINNLSFDKPAQSKQLGMSNVPVLNQGPHGTCVTFANTAAIDAVLNQEDYISELCQLQLGQYLEDNSYNPSGWNGSFGPVVLHQMQSFGLVSKTTQRQQGCNDLTEYPAQTTNDTHHRLSLPDYHKLSEPFPEDKVAWSPLLDIYQVFMDKQDPNLTLQHVIQAIQAGDRLTFGALLFNLNAGTAGAVGQYHAANDTWVITPEIIHAINQQEECGGHEMIITGYDDNAIAKDPHGTSHKGLLTLRNSWGPNIGDHGDFYMSYDYFKALVVEIQRIRHLN